LPGETEEKHRNHRKDCHAVCRHLNPVPPQYEAGVPTPRQRRCELFNQSEITLLMNSFLKMSLVEVKEHTVVVRNVKSLSRVGLERFLELRNEFRVFQEVVLPTNAREGGRCLSPPCLPPPFNCLDRYSRGPFLSPSQTRNLIGLHSDSLPKRVYENARTIPNLHEQKQHVGYVGDNFLSYFVCVCVCVCVCVMS